MNAADRILAALANGERLTLAGLREKTKLPADALRTAIIELEHAGQLEHFPAPWARWEQTWKRARDSARKG